MLRIMQNIQEDKWKLNNINMVDEFLEDGDLKATFIFEGKRDLEFVATEGEFPTFDWHIGQDGFLGASSNVFLGKYIKPTEK